MLDYDLGAVLESKFNLEMKEILGQPGLYLLIAGFLSDSFL